jgi:HK97 family phage portal protein
LVLDHGFDFKPVSLNPEQLKLIETRNIQVAEIARILNVPIYIVASEMAGSYNSIETMSLDFYKRTLSPIIYMIEQELRQKLLTKKEINEDFIFRGSIQSLLRGDSSSRASFYRELFYLGAISPEEIREIEDMPQDIVGETYVQANLIPKVLIKDYYDAKIDEAYNKIDKKNLD